MNEKVVDFEETVARMFAYEVMTKLLSFGENMEGNSSLWQKYADGILARTKQLSGKRINKHEFLFSDRSKDEKDLSEIIQYTKSHRGFKVAWTLSTISPNSTETIDTVVNMEVYHNTPSMSFVQFRRKIADIEKGLPKITIPTLLEIDNSPFVSFRDAKGEGKISVEEALQKIVQPL